MMPMVNVVIPTLGKDRFIVDLLQQIAEDDDDIVRHVYVMDNGMDEATRKDCRMFPKVIIIPCPNMGIYAMWNAGVALSRTVNKNDYIAILNDDLQLFNDNFFTSLVEPMDINSNIWATCGDYPRHDSHTFRVSDMPSYLSMNSDLFYLEFEEYPGTFKDHGFAGFCFAVNPIAFDNGVELFDERYNCWYGDDELITQIYRLGKRVAIPKGSKVIHINGGSNTFGDRCRIVNDENAKDTELYYSKWHNG